MKIETNKGYTLIEVLMVVGISLSILLTLHYIPVRITESFQGYLAEVSINRANHHLASAIHEDLKKHSTIMKTKEGFKIGESDYIFNQEGVYRTLNGTTLQLANEELSVEFTSTLVKIQSTNTEENKKMNRSIIYLVFPIENQSTRIGGGHDA